jgi:Transposase IS116/IS110/IS902 family
MNTRLMKLAALTFAAMSLLWAVLTEAQEKPGASVSGDARRRPGGCGHRRSEVGDIRRFANARQLMAYLGLVPSEHSSGASVRRGGITKAGSCRI